MSMVRVSLAFAQFRDVKLSIFTHSIIDSLTGNASFPAPVVPLATLTAALTAFTDALAAAAQGGRQSTAEKNNQRAALIAWLRLEANYVQGVAMDNLPVLLSSGFSSINLNRAQVQLAAPLIMKIENAMSTQLAVRLTPVPTARAYEVQYKNGTGGWLSGGGGTQARRFVVPNLTPGSLYTLQARAIGGSTGYSDWSDPVSHMAM